MSYSRRQLYAMGEPLGDGATHRAVGGKVIYGSGGGGGSAEKQTTIVDLPEWAKPYAKESLGKAAALTSSPYQTYGGERTAQFSPLQKQAFDAAAQQGVAGQIGAGSGLAGTAGLAGLTGGYKAGQFGSQMGQYMSPYMDAVVQRQMESAQRQADIAGTQRGAQAVRAGAFGGSRQAVENAEAARALASQKGEIQAQGLQSAYDRATDMYGREQALAEQSRQAGLSTALGAAGQLGQLGQQQFGQQMGITDLQQQLGGQQRAATQDILSTQYQDFLNQQRAPFDQLSFMSSIIRGTPMGQTTTQYQPPASPTSQLLGLGIAGAGAYGAYQGAQNRAAGGEVKGYAAGGITDLNQPQMAAMAGRMSDQQLQRTRGIPSITEIAELTLDNEAKQRALTRQLTDGQEAVMAPRSQSTVAEERMAMLDRGIGSLDVPDNLVVGDDDEYTAAGGGIVAFSRAGEVPMVYGGSFEDFEPYRPGAYLRSGDKRIDPRTNQPITFGDFLRLQQEEKAKAAQPVAQGIISSTTGDNRAAMNRAALNRADAGIRSLPALTDAEKAAQAVVTTKPPAPSAAPGAAPRNTGPVPGAAPAMPSGGLADIFKDIDAQKKELTARAKEAEGIELAGLEKQRTELDKAEEEAKKYGSEQEEKYKKRGERLDKAEKGNIYQTMMEAGLAIAAGESPNALKNLAVGAQQGLKGYQTRLEKVNEGRDGLEDAMFKLYNIRNDKVTAVGDKKRELTRAETKIQADAIRSLNEISKGMFGEELKLKTKEIDRAFDVWKTKYEQGQANIRAQAGRSPDELALLTKYPAGTPEGDTLRKNIEFRKRAGGDPTMRRAEYNDLSESLKRQQLLLMGAMRDPAKAALIQEEIKQIKSRMAELTAPDGSSARAGSGTVDTKNPLLGP